ncbi:MAG TPA: hypothetical protein VFT22_38535 [Kofleriaceae bacterium]|nr:hypothetical protein [Kofleriaceae bacterium]
MAFLDVVRGLRALRVWLPGRRRRWAVGKIDVGDARRIADAERRAGAVPDGCAWLDERTIDDVDLPLVFRAIDRTVTPTGAQALWRWLAAPAVRLDVLGARERALAQLAARPALRDRIRDALAGLTASDAPHLPRLLWEAAAAPRRTGVYAVRSAALVVLGALAAWWPLLAVGCVALFVANIVADDWASLSLASHGHALGVLGQALAAAERVLALGVWPAAGAARDAAGAIAGAGIAADLATFAGFRRQLWWLTVSDPFGLADLLRAGLLVRLLWLGRWMRMVDRERDRLRRIILWLGEVDALVSIASLRAERADTRAPVLSASGRRIAGRDLVHPAIAGAIGNDVALDAGLLITGSNMSGKSTFLRTLAVNAICAQSIHTTFGAWWASLVRVFTVMRVADATAEGMSTYAVEVAATGRLVAAVRRADDELPALLVLDEPFRGTNPALRVPIAVSVLDYLGQRDLVVAATHDLDVAAQVDARFARGYFCESDDERGDFDRKLRPGVAPASNALALLARAGYPPAIVADAERRARANAAAPLQLRPATA